MSHYVPLRKRTHGSVNATEPTELADISAPDDAIARHPLPEEVFAALGHAIDVVSSTVSQTGKHELPAFQAPEGCLNLQKSSICSWFSSKPQY
jgi:hypothetical protein